MNKFSTKVILIVFFSILCANLVVAEPLQEIEIEPETAFTKEKNELQEATIEQTTIFAKEIEETKELSDENQPHYLKHIPKLETIIKSTDVNKPFLKDKLHFEYEKGPIEDLTVYSAYRGDFQFSFLNNDYHTFYRNNMMDLGIYGKFREVPVDYRFSLNFVPKEGMNYLNSLVLDNFISLNAIPHHKIYVGHMRTPIGIEGGKSGYVTPFMNRSQISRTFSNVRTIGVKVIGNYDLFDYNLGVYSSSRYLQQFFPGAEFTGWVNLKPLGKTSGKYGKIIMGGGLNAGHKDDSYTVGGLYAAYEYKRFNWDFEYSAANGYNGVLVNSTNKANGFYTTAAYKLTDKIQVLARYDQFTPNSDKSSASQKEYSAGINYFIKGQALKVMLNYVFYENFEKNNGNRIYLGTQVLL